MKPFLSTLGLLLILTGASSPLWAHGGSHDAPAPPAEATLLPELPEETVGEGPLMEDVRVSEETLGTPEAPATGDNDTGPVDYGMGDLPSSMAGNEGMEGATPLWGEEPAPPGTEPAPMDLSHMSEHGDHDMPEGEHAAMTKDAVKPAEHEWIKTSRKGYWWALALVILGGAWFGFLDWKKPFER